MWKREKESYLHDFLLLFTMMQFTNEAGNSSNWSYPPRSYLTRKNNGHCTIYVIVQKQLICKQVYVDIKGKLLWYISIYELCECMCVNKKRELKRKKTDVVTDVVKSVHIRQ